jgi:hypothetical protein
MTYKLRSPGSLDPIHCVGSRNWFSLPLSILSCHSEINPCIKKTIPTAWPCTAPRSSEGLVQVHIIKMVLSSWLHVINSWTSQRTWTGKGSRGGVCFYLDLPNTHHPCQPVCLTLGLSHLIMFTLETNLGLIIKYFLLCGLGLSWLSLTQTRYQEPGTCTGQGSCLSGDPGTSFGPLT